MKSMIFIPPAQAEALSDTLGDLLPDDGQGDLSLRQPWRDEEGSDDWAAPESVPRPRAGIAAPYPRSSNAQLWPSSVNSSR